MEEDNFNNPYYIYGEKKKKKAKPPRVPIDEPEGANTKDFPRDLGGKPRPGGVSLTEIEVLDLTSEGQISGLVDVEYTFAGTLGNIGYDSVTATPYSIAPGLTVRWPRSIYWNEVPVVNTQNQFNFTDVDVLVTNGLPNGAITSRVNEELTNSRAINERLRYGPDFAKTYRVLNKDCRFVEINVKVGQLSVTDKAPATAGDVKASSVSYLIYTRPIYSTVGRVPAFSEGIGETIEAKVSYGYIRKTRIKLNKDNNDLANDSEFLGWEIKIQRTTPDSTDLSLRNQTVIDSITEVYGDIFCYPNSAIVSSKFSAEYFAQIPERAYDTRGLLVKVPDTYDPILKTYTEGVNGWEGDFKDEKAWTDNPAWCYYDLLTNQRYGLGKYIDSDYIDKWTLYQIGKYCDTLVSDGEGGLEPRFTCNLLLSSRDEAYRVVNNFASIFRALTYYGGGGIYAVQDSPKTDIYQFTNANVENGDFLYSSSSKRVRNTVSMVRYNDKKNFYLPAVEYVEDIDGIRKYGIREFETTALGCTSRGQALRFGRWALLTESLETESVSFIAGIEGAYLRPGDVIKIFDSNRYADRYGGRTYLINTGTLDGDNNRFDKITLDSYITGFNNSRAYALSLLVPTYSYDPVQTTDLNSTDFDNIRRSHVQTRMFSGYATSGWTGENSIVRSVVTLSGRNLFTGNGFTLSGNNYVWTIETSGNAADPGNEIWDYYRTLSITENEDGLKYNVTAIEYNVDKYLKIESGLSFQQPNYLSAPQGPTTLTLSLEKISDNAVFINYSFVVSTDLTNVNAYLVYVKTSPIVDADVNDSTYLIARLPKSTTNGQYLPTQDGTYYFRIYAVNAQGTKSTSYATDSIPVNGINPIKDITISSLRLSDDEAITNAAGTRLSSITFESEPTFLWQAGVNQSQSISADFLYRLSFRQPSSSSTPTTNIYWQTSGRMPDNQYQLPFSGNRHLFYDAGNNIGGPFREYDVVVEAITTGGNSSAGGNIGNAITHDAEYSNIVGYDILNARNIPITNLDLGVCPSDFCTDQWISPDGDVKVSLTNGDLPEDFAGGFLYTCPVPFIKDEAYGNIPTSKVIKRFEFGELENSQIAVSPNYSNIDKAYIAISFADTFDDALAEEEADNNVFNIATGLYLSPVIQIEKRKGIKNGAAFVYWVELKFTANNASNPDWSNNLDILSVTVLNQTATHYRYNVIFKNPLSNSNYVPVISESTATTPVTVQNRSSFVNSFEKRTDGFIVNVPGQGGQFGTIGSPISQVFIGILSLV